MQITADFQQVVEAQVSCAATDGEAVQAEQVVVVPILIPADRVAVLVASYDATDPQAPDADTARELSRAVLDALARYSSP